MRNNLAISMSQEQILMTLVQGEDGRVWASDRLGWSIDDQAPVPVCDWKGVSCEDGITVTDIDLSNSNFIGSIPAGLGQLSSLKSLILSQNIVEGPIPKEVAALPKLEIFDVSYNRVSGTIPKFSSDSLSKIVLADNMLNGPLPLNFGMNHPNLLEVDIIRNQLDGVLPDTLGLLTSLNKFSISENKFYGLLPENLGYLRNLEYLYLDSNNFVGTIPRSLTPADSPLKEVWLQQNLFSGTVPAAFAEMKDLVNLYVDGNKFTGQLPEDLCKSEINADFFEDSDDMNVTARDYCASIACPVGTVSLEGVWPCSPCADGSQSPYLGQEAACIPNSEPAILYKFWVATNGNDWSVRNNWFADGVDHCDFTGISCNSEHQVLSINLSNFNLRGTIPDEIGFLEHLKGLDLSRNQLYGYLPSDIRFAPLDTLDVSGNKLVGIVPPMLCLKGGVNGNGVTGDYNCDHIACPAGYYSTSGRAGQGNVCERCYDGVGFLGKTSCNGAFSVSSGRRSNMSKGGVIGLSFALIAIVVGSTLLCYIYFKKKRRDTVMTRHLDDTHDFGISDHLDVEGKMPPPADPLYVGTFPDSVEVEEMHDDDFSSITRVRKKKDKKGKRRKGGRKKSSASYENVVTEEDEDESKSEQESVASNPVWLDVPKLERPTVT